MPLKLLEKLHDKKYYSQSSIRRFINWRNWSFLNRQTNPNNYWNSWSVNYFPVSAIHDSDDNKGTALAALVVLMAMAAAAVFSVMYSLTKIKKATENLLMGRKKISSVLRFVSAFIFAGLGWVVGTGIGLFYASALLGSLSAPIFGLLGSLVISAVGIMFTKYLIQGARWFRGLPSNSGHNSLSADAVENYKEVMHCENLLNSNLNSVHKDEDVCQKIAYAGKWRSFFYRSEKKHTDKNISDYRSRFGQGLVTSELIENIKGFYENELTTFRQLKNAPQEKTLNRLKMFKSFSEISKVMLEAPIANVTQLHQDEIEILEATSNFKMA